MIMAMKELASGGRYDPQAQGFIIFVSEFHRVGDSEPPTEP
jgi:hypothetical protein